LEINEKKIEMVKIIDKQAFPIEFLNSLAPCGMAPYFLNLKENACYCEKIILKMVFAMGQSKELFDAQIA